jgi:hypothetical protein
VPLSETRKLVSVMNPRRGVHVPLTGTAGAIGRARSAYKRRTTSAADTL